jgi:hypothetical protein
MAKCATCGGFGSIDYEFDLGEKQAWKCPACEGTGEATDAIVPRVRKCCDLQDPTPPEVDDKVAGLMKDLTELASLLEDVRKGWDAEILANVQLRKESEGRLAELVRLVREMETMKADLAFEKAENARWEVVCDEMEAEVDRLRGLLREAVEAWNSPAYRFDFLNWRSDAEWNEKAQAALEGKP